MLLRTAVLDGRRVAGGMGDQSVVINVPSRMVKVEHAMLVWLVV